MNDKPDPVDKLLLVPRIVFGTFGLAFAGIGITVISFLWLTPFHGFDSPPLFFRIFGSFIALVFVVVGGTTLLGAVLGDRMLSKVGPGQAAIPGFVADQATTPLVNPTTYRCTNCGAHLGKEADVSPLGDVKCAFCHRWFNIHAPTVDA